MRFGFKSRDGEVLVLAGKVELVGGFAGRVGFLWGLRRVWLAAG